MRITLISDTHGRHAHFTSNDHGNLLGSGDILIHAGDVSNVGRVTEIYNFLDWFSDVDYTHKVFIAGNHDWGFEKMTEIPEIFREKNVHYLFDSMVEIDGLKIYGSPWQPEFFNWAFNLPRMGSELQEKWDLIPEGLDILVTHGPCWGILDNAPNGLNVGCELLQERVAQVSPKIHVFGHIHHSYGQKYFNGTEYINAALLDERYNPTNKPIMIDYDVNTKKFDYV
jgi:Icc-related predicted phosphoesterase